MTASHGNAPWLWIKLGLNSIRGLTSYLYPKLPSIAQGSLTYDSVTFDKSQRAIITGLVFVYPPLSPTTVRL